MQSSFDGQGELNDSLYLRRQTAWAAKEYRFRANNLFTMHIDILRPPFLLLELATY